MTTLDITEVTFFRRTLKFSERVRLGPEPHYRRTVMSLVVHAVVHPAKCPREGPCVSAGYAPRWAAPIATKIFAQAFQRPLPSGSKPHNGAAFGVSAVRASSHRCAEQRISGGGTSGGTVPRLAAG